MGTLEIRKPERNRALLGQYRLYFLDSPAADQLIADSYEFEAASDGAAIQLAEAKGEGRPIELWRGALQLRSWNSEPRGADGRS